MKSGCSANSFFFFTWNWMTELTFVFVWSCVREYFLYLYFFFSNLNGTSIPTQPPVGRAHFCNQRICLNFTFQHVATFTFLHIQFSIVCWDNAVLMVLLGLGTKPAVVRKTLCFSLLSSVVTNTADVWSKISVFSLTTTAGKRSDISPCHHHLKVSSFTCNWNVRWHLLEKWYDMTRIHLNIAVDCRNVKIKSWVVKSKTSDSGDSKFAQWRKVPNI